VAARDSAVRTAVDWAAPGKTLWFEGHWGFQYYLQLLGGVPLDKDHLGFQPGDVLALPLDNINLEAPPGARKGFSVEGPHGLANMDPRVGAGFYSSVDGPLPFFFGHIPPQNVAIYQWQPHPPANH
jgi:hypothetical protein